MNWSQKSSPSGHNKDTFRGRERAIVALKIYSEKTKMQRIVPATSKAETGNVRNV